MNITIIGHGNVGGALARRFLAAGHKVTIGCPDPNAESVTALVSQTQGFQVLPLAECAKGAEAVLFATPAKAVLDVAMQLGNLKDCILIDATNTIMPMPGGPATAFDALSQQFPDAFVVKCFNSTGFENMQNPQFAENMAADMFMAGNSAKAKEAVRGLALSIGFAECYDFGDASKAQLLEAFAKAWINLALSQGMGRNIVLKLHRRAN